MRARNIKPGFFKNELLGQADPLLSLLFAGLWCLADRDGLLEDRPLRIKAELFPYRPAVDVNGELTVLERLGFIRRFQHGEFKLIYILNFKTHQAPHHTEKKSVWSVTPSELEGCNSNGGLTVNSPLEHGEYPPDSLIPDSLILDSSNTSSCSTSLNESDPYQLAANASKRFRENGQHAEKIYKKYPRKVGKAKAISAIFSAFNRLEKGNERKDFDQLAVDKPVADWLLERVERFANSKVGTSGQFCPHPTTWFNQSRYLDDPEEWNRDDGGGGDGRHLSRAERNDRAFEKYMMEKGEGVAQ